MSSVVQIPAASPLRRSCPVDIKRSQRHRSYLGSGSSSKVWLVAGFQALQCGALILSLPWWDPLSSSLRSWRPPLGGQGASASCSLGLYKGPEEAALPELMWLCHITAGSWALEDPAHRASRLHLAVTWIFIHWRSVGREN